MKSIVEEAASIAKAIENGWVRAGRPQEFTIRIYEEPEKNFLGFTKKPAKVGLFYKETLPQQPSRGKETKRQQTRPVPQKPSPEKRQLQKARPPQNPLQGKPATTTQSAQPQMSEQQKQPKWTPQLIDGSKEWLQIILRTLGKESIQFTIEQRQYFLTIRFASQIVHDKRKEQLLFKNWSHLLLQALRHRFKRGLRGYKVIITSAA